jgi:hypothetical protein
VAKDITTYCALDPGLMMTDWLCNIHHSNDASRLPPVLGCSQRWPEVKGKTNLQESERKIAEYKRIAINIRTQLTV